MSSDIPIVGADELPVSKSVKIRGVPGAGKTTQATLRVAELIQNHGYDIDDLTWVTYRRSLAEDVIESLVEDGVLDGFDAALPSQGRTRYITTTHAAAYRCCADKDLRENRPPKRSDYIDFCSSYYNVRYDSDEQSSHRPCGERAFQVLYWLRNTMTHPSDAYESPAYQDYRSVWPRGPDMTEFARDWEQYKDENGIYDYYEMLQKALDSPKCPTDGIVVADEYHDATPLMDAVLQKWMENADVAIAVGDTAQTINVHEGAEPALFESLDYPVVDLSTTYRVPSQQWSLATDILTSTHDNRDIGTDRDNGLVKDVRSPRFVRRDDEWFDVPSDEKAAPPRFAEAYDDLMFLCRTRLQANGIAEALRQKGYVFDSQSGIEGWSDRSLKRLNALLKLSSGASELRGDEAAEIIELTDDSYYAKSSDDIWKLVYELRGMDDITFNVVDVASLMTADWRQAYSNASNSVSRLSDPANGALDRPTLRSALDRYDDPVGYNLSEFPLVQTIHAAKGMEAQTVVLYDGVTSRIQQSIQRNPRLEATEDRVWYVAVTRASERLYVLRDAFEWTVSYLPRGISATSSTTTGATTND